MMERNAFGLTRRDMNTIHGILAKYPAVQNVVIFGSRAKGTYHYGSDIDLAIMNDGVTETVISKIKSDFEDSSLPYFVDLVYYPTLSHLELKDHIERIGIIFVTT